MKINRRKSPIKVKKIAIITGAAVVAAALIYGGSAFAFKLWPFQTHPATQTTSTKTPVAPTTNATKEGLVVPSAQAQKTTDQIPVNTALAASITTLAESNNQVNFSATVNSTDTSGTCYVEFSNPNDKSVIPTISPAVGSDSTTCGPIQIPAQNFTYLGDWTVTFRYYTSDSQVVATGSITIQ